MAKQITSRALVVGLCVWGLLPVGCGEDTSERDRTGKPRVALIMKSLANEFFKTMEDGAVAHQKANADTYDLICNGIKNEQDVAKQVDLVEQMIAQDVDVIVIAPADSKALVPVCKKAQRAGIVVVNIDNKFDATVLKEENVRIPFVGPDNRRGARLAGEHLAKKLKAGDKVAIVEGATNAFNGDQRKLGFEDAMKAVGVEIVSSQTGKWEAEPAEKVVTGMISEHPEIKAILCANDSMALGAVAALRSANRADVLVIGYDNISAVRELMKEGKVLCTVEQYGAKIATNGVEFALMVLGATARETPVKLVTSDGLTR
ncbi:MAG: sugar ABC transporter substrate-binding protein [Phycisphaerae bacterium]|nr:sugar ABC transporter substrate-binding protein [Phycisphaerae bacterium]